MIQCVCCLRKKSLNESQGNTIYGGFNYGEIFFFFVEQFTKHMNKQLMDLPSTIVLQYTRVVHRLHVAESPVIVCNIQSAYYKDHS